MRGETFTIGELAERLAGGNERAARALLRYDGGAGDLDLYAEDPAENFRPSPGHLEVYVPPGGPGVRLDSHVYQGYDIPPTYDSLIGKLIVHRPTRTEAIATMRRALGEYQFYPIKTTVPLHQKVLADSTFIDGDFDTSFVEKRFMD